MFVVRPHYIHQEIGTPLLDLFFKENNSYVIAGYLTHRNKYTSNHNHFLMLKGY